MHLTSTDIKRLFTSPEVRNNPPVIYDIFDKNNAYKGIDSGWGLDANKALGGKYSRKTAGQLKAQADYARAVNQKWLKESGGAIVDSSLDIAPSKVALALLGIFGGKAVIDYTAEKSNEISDNLEKQKTDIDSASPVPDLEVATAPMDSSKFFFDGENSPALLQGLMNSGEIVAQAIGSLIQITYEGNQQRDAIMASYVQNQYEQNEMRNAWLEGLFTVHTKILENLNTFATAESINALVEPLGAVAGAVANIPQTTLETTNTNTEQPDLSHLNEWASIAKQNEQFKQQTQAFYDSDGAKIAEMSPQQLRAQKDAQLQKNLNDHNTVKFEDDDFSPPMWTGNLFMPFSGREITFDISKPIGSNPFLPTGA